MHIERERCMPQHIVCFTILSIIIIWIRTSDDTEMKRKLENDAANNQSMFDSIKLNFFFIFFISCLDLDI